MQESEKKIFQVFCGYIVLDISIADISKKWYIHDGYIYDGYICNRYISDGYIYDGYIQEISKIYPDVYPWIYQWHICHFGYILDISIVYNLYIHGYNQVKKIYPWIFLVICGYTLISMDISNSLRKYPLCCAKNTKKREFKRVNYIHENFRRT